MQICSSELLQSRSQDKNLGSVEGILFFHFNHGKPYKQEVLLHRPDKNLEKIRFPPMLSSFETSKLFFLEHVGFRNVT